MRRAAVIPFVLGLLFIIGCGNSEEREQSADIEYTTETIALETMKCQMCAATVQQAASKVEGVEWMDVSLEQKVGTVRYNPEKTSLQDIESAIAKSGFHANETQRDEEAYAKLPDCCR